MTAPCAQTNPASPATANTPERPWVILTLNDADPTLVGVIALNVATRKALTEPGRHPVDLYMESLDAWRFPLGKFEDEMVALLAKKYATIHIDAVIAVGSVPLAFAEKHRGQLWPDARILFQVVAIERLGDIPLSQTTTGIPVKGDFAASVKIHGVDAQVGNRLLKLNAVRLDQGQFRVECRIDRDGRDRTRRPASRRAHGGARRR